MANTPWRCEHPDGDVKIAVREDHKIKLELKGYSCVLDPDAQYDEHDTKEGLVPEEVILNPDTGGGGGGGGPAGAVTTLDPVVVDVNIVLSNGNRTAFTTYDDDANVVATTARSTGKYYWESTVDQINDNSWAEYGMGPLGVIPETDGWPSQDGNAFCMEIGAAGYNGGDIWYHDSSWKSYVGYGSAEVGSVAAMAVNLDLGYAWFGYVGLGWAGGGDPATNTAPSATFTPGTFAPASSLSDMQLTFNFGQEVFAGEVPVGYSAWG